MSAPYPCFYKVIGLADTSCNCYDDDFPADASESASGLQLADLEGLSLSVMKQAVECGAAPDLGTLLEKARTEGTRRTKSDIGKYVQLNTKWKRPPVRSQVGDKSGSALVNMNSTYHGLEVKLAHHVGGTATVKRIGAYFNDTGTLDLDVYDRDGLLETVTVDTQAGIIKWTDVDIELSMETERALNPAFWFLYAASGNQALTTKIHCGCNGTRDWNGTQWFESEVKRNDEAWMVWAMAGGVKGTSVADREDWAMGNETQGIILDVQFSCDPSTALCNGYPDYQNDRIQESIAYAVRYASGSWMVSQILASTNVNRETLTGDGENYYRLKAIYEKGFKEHAIDWVGASLVQPPEDGMPASGVNTYSDCFWCKSKSGFKLGTIKR